MCQLLNFKLNVTRWLTLNNLFPQFTEGLCKRKPKLRKNKTNFNFSEKWCDRGAFAFDQVSKWAIYIKHDVRTGFWNIATYWMPSGLSGGNSRV